MSDEFLKAEDKSICPRLKDVCIRNKCVHWQTFTGSNPVTGEEIGLESDCAFNWQTFLMIENRKATNGVQVATESFRNEIYKAAQISLVKKKGLLGWFK